MTNISDPRIGMFYTEDEAEESKKKGSAIKVHPRLFTTGITYNKKAVTSPTRWEFIASDGRRYFVVLPVASPPLTKEQREELKEVVENELGSSKKSTTSSSSTTKKSSSSSSSS